MNAEPRPIQASNVFNAPVFCISMLLYLCLPASVAFAGYAWLVPKGDFTLESGNMKNIDGTTYAIHIEQEQTFTARYNDLHPDLGTLTPASN